MEEIGKWLKGAKAYYLQSYKESSQVMNPIFSAHSVETLKEFIKVLEAYIPNTQLRGIE